MQRWLQVATFLVGNEMREKSTTALEREILRQSGYTLVEEQHSAVGDQGDWWQTALGGRSMIADMSTEDADMAP